MQLPLFDRLSEEYALDAEVGSRENFRRSIRHDIEALLNSKLHWHVWPEWYGELDRSLMTYGLPDFSSMPLSSQDGRDSLCRVVEQAIRTFEPRFVDVSVETLDKEQPLDRILKLRICAICMIDGEPEEVVFDSEVEPVCLGIKVSE
ncbi:type VI secretion system baseplate subunit TssE [Vibrio atypicus]|uniref:type VI secretion system baseplate subunit TssE n=1 Tax=Vibrio atypicus TaxID=558271 RepID=UPI0037369075